VAGDGAAFGIVVDDDPVVTPTDPVDPDEPGAAPGADIGDDGATGGDTGSTADTSTDNPGTGDETGARGEARSGSDPAPVKNLPTTGTGQQQATPTTILLVLTFGSIVFMAIAVMLRYRPRA